MSQTAYCPLCADISTFAEQRHGLFSCVECHLWVAPGLWTPHENESMEEEWFGDGYHPDASFWNRWFESRNNLRTSRRIRRVAGRIGRMLEIGIGSGSFLGFMQKQGWEVLGCDLSAALCRRAQERWSTPTHCGGVETLPTQDTYDLVVMNHVIEHTQHPLTVLHEVRTRMNPGGYLHLAMPNLHCWEARLPGWNSYEPYHLLYFTAQTVRRMLKTAGFRVVCLGTHESFSGWFLALLRTMVRQTLTSGGSRRFSRQVGRSLLVEHLYRLSMTSTGVITWPLRRLQEQLGQGDELFTLACPGRSGQS